MAGSLVLITGATGFIGFRTLITTLEAGYRARVAVRNAAGIEKLKANKALQPHLSNVEFVIVPDFTAEGAFAHAFEHVEYVLHLASPLPQGVAPGDDLDKVLIQPAINATLTVLEQAKLTPSVKRVVVTGSVVSIIPFENVVAQESKTVYDATMTLDMPKYSNAWDGYAASKVAAYNASWKWMAEQKPGFDLIQILPGPVLGAGDLFTTVADVSSGMNFGVTAALNGTDGPGLFSGNTVHVQDVASLHVWSLKPEIQGGQSFLATSGGVDGNTWEDAKDIARKYFPEAVASGQLKLNGTQPTLPTKIDSSATEKAFNFTFKPYSEQVRDIAQQYLALSA